MSAGCLATAPSREIVRDMTRVNRGVTFLRCVFLFRLNKHDIRWILLPLKGARLAASPC